MSNTQKKNLLALSVAALVASSVAAVAGVTTFERDLTGKSVYLGYEMGHSYDSSGYSGGSAYPSTGTASTGTTGASTATSTTTGSPKPTCPTNLATCQKSCVTDGLTNTFCMKWCAEACPTTTTTSTSTAATISDRCAHANSNCAERVRCLIETAACGSPKVEEQPTCDAIKAAATARGVKSPAVNMETGMAYCDELKAAPPPAPVTEAPAPVVDVPAVDAPTTTKETPIIEDADVRHEAAFEEDDFESEGDFGGEYDDFRGHDDFSSGFGGGPDFGGGFDMGFGGPDEAFMHSVMDQYGVEFDPSMMDGYFMSGGDFGGGDDFGEDFGGGYGDDFGGMPIGMEDELENMKDMMRGMAEHMCPDFSEEFDDIEDFEGLEELGYRMQEECMGEGGLGGPMEDPAEIVEMLRAMVEGINGGLDVLQGHGFDADIAGRIRGLLTQIGTVADEAEDACADLGFGEEEEDEDFFGLKGLLAQIFDDEEEDDEEFEEDDEEGGACREAIEEAFYLMDPDSDEDYPNSVRGIMQPAIEDYFRKLHEEDEAKSREVFAAFMKEMAPVVVGDEMELSDEDIDGMYDMLVESDFNFDAVGNPHAEGGEWEANFDNVDEEEGFESERGFEEEEEGGKAGGGGFEEEEFNEEGFDF